MSGVARLARDPLRHRQPRHRLYRRRPHLHDADLEAGRENLVKPVIGECDDGFLDDNRFLALTEEHVVAAMTLAATGTLPEDCVGAGTDMQPAPSTPTCRPPRRRRSLPCRERGQRRLG